MKLFISFALAGALLLPAPLFAKEAPKVPIKKAATAKSATQVQKKPATKNAPIKKTAQKKKIVSTKKTVPKAPVKTPAALPLKKSSAQKPPLPPLKQPAPLKQAEATEVQSQMPEKKVEPPPTDTKSKVKELLEKLEEAKKTVPTKPESVKLRPIEKQPVPEQKYWLDQPTQDAPVRDYYKEHPGSYSPPLLKYDLPSGVY